MTATKSKRVRVGFPVRVRPMSVKKETAWKGAFSGLVPCIAIYNPPPSLKVRTVKRLVEIAAMDYDDAFVHVSNDGYSYSEARVICAFLRLPTSTPKRRANRITGGKREGAL